MNKAELVRAVSHLSGHSQIKTEEFINAFTECVKNELKVSGNVYIRGFGTFEVKKHEAKVVKSQFTKKADKLVPAHGVVKFIPSNELKNGVKGV